MRSFRLRVAFLAAFSFVRAVGLLPRVHPRAVSVAYTTVWWCASDVSGFIGGNKTYEGVMRMAELSVESDEPMAAAESTTSKRPRKE